MRKAIVLALTAALTLVPQAAEAKKLKKGEVVVCNTSKVRIWEDGSASCIKPSTYKWKTWNGFKVGDYIKCKSTRHIEVDNLNKANTAQWAHCGTPKPPPPPRSDWVKWNGYQTGEVVVCPGTTNRVIIYDLDGGGQMAKCKDGYPTYGYSNGKWAKWNGYQTGEVIVCPGNHKELVETDGIDSPDGERTIGMWGECEDNKPYGRRS